MVLSDSSLSLVHVLKSIDSRFQNLRRFIVAGSFVTLPSSDEEGGSATCRDDGRRDNVPIELRRFAGSAKRVLSLSRLRRQLPHQVEPRNEAISNCGISMKALNLWAFMRGFVVRSNRTETQNPCPLSLWGHGFVFYNTAVAGSGHSPHAESTTFELMGTWIRLL